MRRESGQEKRAGNLFGRGRRNGTAAAAVLPWALFNDECGRAFAVFSGEAFSQEIDNLVAQGITAVAPALSAHEHFNTGAEALEAKDIEAAFKVAMKFSPKILEKAEFEIIAPTGDFLQVGDGDGDFASFIGSRADFVAEAVQDFFECPGKFPD